MERKRGFGPEIKVGLFVLVGLLLLIYMSVRLGKISFGKEKGYTVTAVFDSVSGLVKDSTVEMAGIEIGRVKDVRLTDGRAEVTMLVSPNVKIHKDAAALVRTKGVLGDRFIEIRQGQSPDNIPPGGMIAKTESPLDLDRLLAKVVPAVENIESVATGINQFLGGKEQQADFKATLSNLRSASDSFKTISREVESGKGTLGKLIKDETLYAKAEQTMGALNDVARKVEKGEGTLGKLVTDETLYNKAKETLDSINTVSQKVARGEGALGKFLSDEGIFTKATNTMDSLYSVAQKVDQGQGTLGKLVNDPELYNEAKKALRNVNRASSSIEEQVPVTILGTVVGTLVR